LADAGTIELHAPEKTVSGGESKKTGVVKGSKGNALFSLGSLEGGGG